MEKNREILSVDELRLWPNAFEWAKGHLPSDSTEWQIVQINDKNYVQVFLGNGYWFSVYYYGSEMYLYVVTEVEKGRRK